MPTSLVWLRRDLRVHDHPALATAAAEAEHVVPLFVFDRRLLGGRFRSAGRTAWMLGCLEALDGELRARGGGLVVRDGPDQVAEVVALAREVGAERVHVSDDVTPYARARDARAEAALAADGIALVRHPGCWVVDPAEVLTRQGRPYTVFSPFLRTWKTTPRRDVLDAPDRVVLPDGLDRGTLPDVAALGFPEGAPDLADRPEPGEAAGMRAAREWISGGLTAYGGTRNVLAAPTSRMGAYLRFGCVSARRLEAAAIADGGEGARSYLDELAWRDFYAACLLHLPWLREREFIEKYRGLEWVGTEEDRTAWAEGQTGFPVIDAAMRQLRATGFMHNRARMVVGSFLTKDLGVDWRFGEEHFMHHLLDGDQPANNGGWQWVASTGTDPKPYFQRLFNPMTQQEKFDPDGAYVRRWVPELRDVPDEHLVRPWEMNELQQQLYGCVIGEDYPSPIVDHAEARRRAIERYSSV